MPTATLRSPHRPLAHSFVIAAIAYGVGLFGLFKLGWLETHAVLPLTDYQARVAAAIFGTPALPIDVTLACSGTDAFALCAAAILAYPAPWRWRAGGTAAGFALIIALNIVRIGSLGRAVASPWWFEVLHVYVWPAVLILAVGGAVLAWMKEADARSCRCESHAPLAPTTSRAPAFLIWTVILVAVFVAASPLYLQSATVLAFATAIAQAAAAVLGVTGLTATTIANTLWTSKGGFEVTQECITTPLIPLYGAAVMTCCAQWRWRLPLVVAAVPLFFALGVARLLVVALPATLIGSPLFMVHAFYQVLLATVIIAALATWRRGGFTWRATAAACSIGAASAWLIGPIYSSLFSVPGFSIPFNDSQGAMASLPSFQVGFYLALAAAAMSTTVWRAMTAGLVTLLAVQAVTFAVATEVAQRGWLPPHIRDVRAFAIALPLAIVLSILVLHERARD